MQRTYRVFNVIFLICFFCAAAFLLLRNGFVLALGFLFLTLYLLHRFDIPKFTLWLLVGGLLIRFAVIWILHPPIESDFDILYTAAHSLMEGDLSFSTTAYFSLWAYQSAYVAWEALWLSIWDNPIFLEVVHAVLSAGTVCFLYRIVLPHVRQRSAQAAALLLTVFPFATTLPTVLTNQIPAAFFLVFGIWLLVCPDTDRLRFWRFPLAGLSLQIGNLLRPEGIIVIVAILAWAFFTLLRKPKTYKRLLCGILLLLAVYYAAGFGADGLTKATGLNANGLQNCYPGWKFVCGLNHETRGGYAGEDWDMIGGTLDENHMPTAETERVQKELISQRLNVSAKALFKLLYYKADVLWTRSGLSWAFGHTQGTPSFVIEQAYRIIQDFDRALFFLALALATLGLWKKGGRSPDAYLLYFVFFAAFCAFIPIEVQPRYAYMPQLFIFAAAAFGVDRLTDFTVQKGAAPCP